MALMFRAFLNANFTKLLGRRGTVEWHARSTDVVLSDFVMWALLKGKVFSMKPQSLGHLKLFQ